MTNAAAKTGLGPTAMVAVEQNFPEPQRIIADDLALRMLPFGGRAFVRATRYSPLRNWMVRSIEKNDPGLWAAMTCRKRYIDEKLAKAANGIEAVVNLGAGFDTRMYRLPLNGARIWEVDQAINVRAKTARLRKIFKDIPPHIALVAMDFDTDDLSFVLTSHGYGAGKRTFIVCEAVSQYLTEVRFKKIFDAFARAATGSLLAFTYVRKDFLEGRAMYGWTSAYERFVTKGKLWHFGLEPGAVQDFLDPYGWRVIEDVGYDVLAERYVKPTGRNLASTAVERVVCAEKA